MNTTAATMDSHIYKMDLNQQFILEQVEITLLLNTMRMFFFLACTRDSGNVETL